MNMIEAILVINNYDPNKPNRSKTYENPSGLNRLQFTIVKLSFRTKYKEWKQNQIKRNHNAYY